MAEVYVAEAISMAGFKKKVAIKRILPGLLKDERFVRMFLDEARLSLHLNHANVVSVFDIGVTGSGSDKAYFIVMEFVEGATLKGVLDFFERTKQTIPVPITIWLLNEVLKGLQYAHELDDPETNESLNIVHRDISPPNILVSWNGEVKLTDFGLAKASSQLESTDPGVVKGKFSYLSPEAAHGTSVDLRTDIFAVGILAFELLAGRRLFKGETDWQTVEKVRAAHIPNIQALNPQVTPELEAVIRRALARETCDRYQDCATFADDLLGVLFAMGQRVSSRDFSHLLEQIRAQQKPLAGAMLATEGVSAPTNLIMELMRDEMTNFRSIDEQSKTSLVETGARPLSSWADETLPSSGSTQRDGHFVDRDSVHAAHRGPPPLPVSASAPSRSSSGTTVVQFEPSQAGISLGSSSGQLSVATSRLPSPTPKRERGGTTAAIMLVMLALGAAGAAYFFLVARP